MASDYLDLSNLFWNTTCYFPAWSSPSKEKKMHSIWITGSLLKAAKYWTKEYIASYVTSLIAALFCGRKLKWYTLPTELTSQLGTISKVSQVYLEPSWTLAVGLLAQLVERCTGIARVMGSNPVRQTAKIASIFVSSTAVHIYDFTVVL